MKKTEKKEAWVPPFNKFLFWNIPNGWEDLGYLGLHQNEAGNNVSTVCNVCYGYVKAGRIIVKNRVLPFRYCPKCKIQIKLDNGSYLEKDL